MRLCQWSTAGGPVDSQATQPSLVAPGEPGRTGLHRGHGLTRELRYHHTLVSIVPPRAHKTNSPHAAPAAASSHALRAHVRRQGRCHVRRHTVDFVRKCLAGPRLIYMTDDGRAANALVCAAAFADYQFRTQRCKLGSRCCLHVCYRPIARDEHTNADLRTRRNHRVGADPLKRDRRRALAESSGPAF